MHLFLLLILISFSGFLAARESLPDSQSERKLIVGYSGSPASIDYWKKLRNSLLSRSKDLDVMAIDFSSNEFTFDAQRLALERAARMNIDGMIIGAVTDEVSSSIKNFQQSNIPVIAVGTVIFNDWVTSTITTDNEKAVKLAVEFLLEGLKSSTNDARRVVILCGDKEQEAARIRASVPQRMLSDAGYDVHIYYSKGWYPKYSVEDAISEFSSHGQEIAAVFSCYAGASIASVQTAERYGLRPLLVGFDMDENMREMIQAGRLDATVTQDPARIGAVGIEQMLNVLKGKRSIKQNIDVPARLVTRDNVHNFQ